MLLGFSGALKNINLNTDNIILVKNEINDETVSYAIDKIQNSKNATNLILYLDTPGGKVEDGLQLINEVQKNNMTCIAQRAYSMGFAILQSCKHRYLLPTGKVMQHQISFGFGDSLYKIENYISYVNQMNSYLTELQSKKIKIDPRLFREKTSNDWWLFGMNAVFNNVVDELVNVECSKKLIQSNYTLTVGGRKLVYSNCPLIYKEREAEKNSPYIVFV
jgi:ATP-dependent protease ClpP protease subunit